MKIPEILQVETSQVPGSLASVLNAIADLGLVLEHVTMLHREQGRTLWEITVEIEEGRQDELLAKLGAVPSAKFMGWSDRVFDRHRGGKIEMRSRMPISSQQILRDLYTPGVARVCLAIQKNPEKVFDYTYVSRAVAVITDGSAILGLGNIGARPGLPVIEGKAALFASLVGLSGVPILVESTSIDHFVDVVRSISHSFGAILLEDIAAPRCFEIEHKLRARLDMPVLHDDQHATAVVTLASLLNATRIAGTALEKQVVGIIGLGAAGLGIARLLRGFGVERLIGTDLRPEATARLAELHGQAVTLPELMRRADVVIATTGQKGLIAEEQVRRGQIVLALSNPDPEIEPEAAKRAGAKVAADGKSINNVLAFPGLFAGALRARARAFTDAMLLAAARTIAAAAPEGQLVPDALSDTLHAQVTAAVAAAVEG
ncbi:MAG TPA: malic enzyme-like NAD(P)-binding protein [Steroidobacteraceae bacterium]|nr:malic enzyme-like NAD(P)-binding protein [Steroidobacteraceae bacterium]